MARRRRKDDSNLSKMKYISLRLPIGQYIHFARGRKNGISRPAYSRGLVHYNRRGKLTGRTIRSFFGEPNHYDKEGKCIGFSRRINAFKIAHFDVKGNPIGQTYVVLYFLLIHSFGNIRFGVC